MLLSLMSLKSQIFWKKERLWGDGKTRYKWSGKVFHFVIIIGFHPWHSVAVYPPANQTLFINSQLGVLSIMDLLGYLYSYTATFACEPGKGLHDVSPWEVDLYASMAGSFRKLHFTNNSEFITFGIPACACGDCTRSWKVEGAETSGCHVLIIYLFSFFLYNYWNS